MDFYLRRKKRMFCTKCGRVTELEICDKCKLPIDPETAVIDPDEKPSFWLNFWAFITAPIYLIVSAFRNTRSPRNRSAIESAKKMLWWMLFNFAIILIHYILLDYLNIRLLVIEYAYYFLKWPLIDPIVTLIVCIEEQFRAMKVPRKRKIPTIKE